MSPNAAQSYLKTKVLTATPEQLQLMLYDGALRFGERARAALAARNYEESYSCISRVQKIINELSCTLKHEAYPELCGKLAALYNFAYRKLIEANVERTTAPLDEAMEVLRYQRETWAMLLNDLGKQKAASEAGKIPVPAPDDRMEASIRLSA